MSAIIDQIDQDLVASIKGGDNKTRDTLRLLKSAISNFRIDNQDSQLNDQVVQELIAKEIKKRKESILAFNQANRGELAQNEQEEIDILSKYLPAQLSEEEIRAQIELYLKQNPTDKTGFGTAMSALKQQFGTKADLSFVSKVLQELL